MPQKNFTEKILRTQQKNHKTYKEDWYNNKKKNFTKKITDSRIDQTCQISDIQITTQKI